MCGRPTTGNMGGVRGGDGGSARSAEDSGTGASASISATMAAAQADTLSSGVWKPEAAELPRGAEVGRYVVIGQLGAGGMGVVYAAYDPELDRKVALKLVREESPRGPDSSDGRARLLREAQALARLSHPNVVAVHDAGTLGDRVWLAMEHVEGATLRAWVQTERRWPELLQAMIAAGRGLAAAHAAGLVHRDVKPDNIMVGADGRVRVMDFGLARAAGARVVSAPDSGGPGERLSVSVTRTGAMLGTPAYMAPEQWVGKEADARTDQFAYCVTLWEALFGERPFMGDTLALLAPRVLRGEVRAPPSGRAAPGWLRKALARGLQAEPSRRWPDMATLLARLEHGRTRARRGWIAAGCVVMALAGAGWLGWQQHARAQQAAACVAAGAEIEGVWDEAARSQLAQALRLSGAAHPDATYAKVVPWVDRWSAEWARVRAQVCEEATVAGTRPLAELASATACLEERRDDLVQTLMVLGDGDRVSAARAVQVVAGLPAAAVCADPEVLARRPALPDDAGTRTEVDGLRRELMRVRGLRAAGRLTEGARRAESVLVAADALAYAPLTIQARLAFGGLVGEADPGRAERELARAYADAGAIGADELAATAATELAQLVGVTAARPVEGLVWGQSAAMFVARLGRTGTLAAADVDLAIAAIHTLRGAPAEALPLATRALEIREQALGPDHPGVAMVRVVLAGIHRARGETDMAQAQLDRGAYESAQRELERALPIQEAALGADHPEVGSTLGNLASVLLARGEPSRAMELLERSLHIQAQALGEGHPDVARSVHNLAVLHGRLGDHAEAVTLHERALAARIAALGPDHLDVLQSLDDLGYERRAHDELTAAAEVDAQALALRERVLPAGHTDVAWSLEVLAEVRISQGRLDEAEPLLTRALDIRGRAQPPDHHELASTRVLLGRLALARGRTAEATALLERAVAALAASTEASALARGEAEFALAQALGPRQARARELARAADERFRTAGAMGALRSAALQAWLGH